MASDKSNPQEVMGGLMPKAEKTQCAFAEDEAGNGEGCNDDDVAEHGWEQVPKDDAPIFGAGYAGGQYKVGFADGQGFAAYFTGESAPAHEREYGDNAHKDQVRRPFGRQYCAEGHENGDRWKCKDEFDDALDDVVDIAAVIAGDHTECRAEGEADEYGEQANGEGDAAPAMMRESMSRPKRSVPRRNMGLSLPVPNMWMSVVKRP